jgi:hypothetical protein
MMFGKSSESASTEGGVSRRWLGRAVAIGLPAAVVLASEDEAQATPPTWSTAGNAGTTPPSSFLGTTDAQALVIKTGNAERLRVTSAGLVGVGTTVPGGLVQAVSASQYPLRGDYTGSSGLAGVRGSSASRGSGTAAISGMLTPAGAPGSGSAGVVGTVRPTSGGSTTNGTGVIGHHTSEGVGVYGYTDSEGIGVKGHSVGGIGVNGIATEDGSGAEFSSESGYGAFASSASGIGFQCGSVTGGPALNVQAYGTAIGGAFYSDTAQAITAQTNAGDPTVPAIQAQATAHGYGLLALADGSSAQAVTGQATSGGYAGVFDSDSGVGLYSHTESGSYAAQIDGNAIVAGTLHKSGGSFRIDHPDDPERRYLSHSFVESPDMMNVYNGIATLDDVGGATVSMPSWFEGLNRDVRYQLTPLGAPAPDLHISSEMIDGRFRIAGGRSGQRISWQVTGIRQDRWANAHRIPVESEKPPHQQGTYLHPDLYGQPVTRSEMYVARSTVQTRNNWAVHGERPR